MSNTEDIDGTCELCNSTIYPGDARITTLLYNTVHWECYENE